MKKLPPISGPYQVGCCDIVTKLGVERLLFRLFYPTTNETMLSDSNSTVWLIQPQYATGFCNFLGVKYLSHIFRWMTSDVRTNVVWNAEINIPEQISKLPVVLFSHGLGGNRFCYSGICADLASKGVLVAAVEHADKSACATFYLEEIEERGKTKLIEKWIDFQHVKQNSPDEHDIRNKQVHFRADECCKLLDHIYGINNGDCKFLKCDVDLSLLKNAVDVSNCAIMGHSFGAATSLTVLSKDKRFKAGVGLDAWMFPLDINVYKKMFPVPFLFVNTESFQWASNIANMRKLDADVFNIGVERAMVTLVGTVHQSQSDFPLFIENNLLVKLFKVCGSTDAKLAFKVNNAVAFGFIGKYLNLNFACMIEDAVKEHKSLLYLGSNVVVDEEKIKESKKKLASL